MEFLRFGSSIPGSYWGCCACDIIQNFKVDPDAKASIQLVGGDGGTPLPGKNGGSQFAGPTYRDIFWQRLRFGTHSTRDMPNHAFLVWLSRTQLNTDIGKKWLAILKEAGFEFVRTVNNSVWNVDNYFFALFRNVGPNAVKDPFTPPKEWTDIKGTVPEAWETMFQGMESNIDRGSLLIDLTKAQREAQKVIYDKIGPAKLLTEKEVIEAGAPVILSGLRSRYPQQEKSVRERTQAAEKAKLAAPAQPSPNVFPTTAAAVIGSKF